MDELRQEFVRQAVLWAPTVGVALGFALKDSIANLLAGVMILLYRPFEVGDRIDLGGLAGRVTHVDLRYTELDNEKERVLVPNSRMLTDPIRVAKPPAPNSAA